MMPAPRPKPCARRARAGRVLSSLRHAAASALLLFFARSAAPQEEIVARTMLSPGLSAGLVTEEGRPAQVGKIWFATAKNMTSSGPEGPAIGWETDPPILPSFDSVREIIIQPVTREWRGSDAGEMEYYGLGPVGRASPPPPDWKRSAGGNPAWGRSATAEPAKLLPYLRLAQYCWAPTPDKKPHAKGEYLLRQAVDVPPGRAITRGKLRIAGSAGLREAAVNDSTIHLANRPNFTHAEFEVTQLLRPGRNIVALWAWSDADPRAGAPAIAFHLEIDSTDASAAMPPGEPALAAARNGERLWGLVEGLDPEGLHLKTHYGPLVFPWEDLRGLFFPGGWDPEAKLPRKRGIRDAVEKWANVSEARAVGAPKLGLPLEFEPGAIAQEILFTDGRASRSSPSAVKNDELLIDLAGGESFRSKLAEVAAIYPEPPAETAIQKVREELRPLACRLETLRGESVTGILRKMDGRAIVIEAVSGDFLEIPADAAARIIFPYHAKAAPPAVQRARRVLILGRAEGLEDQETGSEKVIAEFQAAAFEAGIETAMAPDAMLSGDVPIPPQDYPVIAALDPLGEYPDTLAGDGDVRARLEEYARGGGVLFLYSRGGALRTPVVSAGGRFMRRVGGAGLAQRLELRTAHPGGAENAASNPFDRPANARIALQFERATKPPPMLAALPPGIPATFAEAPAFYPMLDGTGKMRAIYALADTGGAHYGPALSVAARGQGKVVIVDHLLWQSEWNGENFSRALLPAILEWAVAGAPE